MTLTAIGVGPPKKNKNTFARPLVVKCNDDQDYVVKFFDGTDKSVLNEYVIGKLAKKVDLPVAEPFQISIEDEGLIKTINHNRASQNKTPITAGFHIGTLDLKLSSELSEPQHQNLDPNKIQNLDKVPDIIGFDIFVCNNDRKGENSLMNATQQKNTPFSYVMIDHGHCFGGPNWSLDGENKLTWNQPGIPWKVDSIIGEQSFSPIIAKLKSLDKPAFTTIAKSAPDEWKKPNDEQQIIDMLDNRDEDKVLEQIMKYNKEQFPNWVRS